MATATIATPPERTNWLEERRKFVGGSDSAAMFNEGYGCRRELVYDKSGKPPDFDFNDKTKKLFERGHRLEPLVAEMFSEITGLSVRRQAARVSKDYPYAGVNMDRQILAPPVSHLRSLWPQVEWELAFEDPNLSASTGLLECKTANQFVLDRARKSGLQVDYVFQMQHGLAVTGYLWGAFALLDVTNLDMEIFPVLRDEPLITAILEETRKVQAEVVAGSLPDALPEGDKRCGSCLWRQTCRGVAYLEKGAGLEQAGQGKLDYATVNDPVLAALASDLAEARKAMADFELTESEIEKQVKAYLEANNLLYVKVPEVGAVIRYAPQPGSMRWDGDALTGLAALLEKEGKPELAERVRGCRKVSKPSRPFNFKVL